MAITRASRDCDAHNCSETLNSPDANTQAIRIFPYPIPPAQSFHPVKTDCCRAFICICYKERRNGERTDENRHIEPYGRSPHGK